MRVLSNDGSRMKKPPKIGPKPPRRSASKPPSPSKPRRSASTPTGTPPLHEDWFEFLSSLTRHGVAFVLVGGHAVAAHGFPRHTEDLDLFVEPTVENGRRLREVLIEFGFGEAAPPPELLGEPGRVFMIGVKPFRIDLLTEISGVTFAEATADAILLKTTAGEIPTLSLRALLTNKRASGRAKDRLDVEALTRVPRRPAR